MQARTDVRVFVGEGRTVDEAAQVAEELAQSVYEREPVVEQLAAAVNTTITHRPETDMADMYLFTITIVRTLAA